MPRSVVAGDLRERSIERVRALAPGERLALTERLADDDLDLFSSARGISRERARLILRQQRRAGRRPSAAAECPP